MFAYSTNSLQLFQNFLFVTGFPDIFLISRQNIFIHHVQNVNPQRSYISFLSS